MRPHCLDMHRKDLRALGEAEQRPSRWMLGGSARTTPSASAALAWTEAVTLIADGHAPDAIYEDARAHFGEKELSDLTLAVATINAWNRLSIAARLVPGTYQPPTHG